jgi:hypothetical protein
MDANDFGCVLRPDCLEKMDVSRAYDSKNMLDISLRQQIRNERTYLYHKTNFARRTGESSGYRHGSDRLLESPNCRKAVAKGTTHSTGVKGIDFSITARSTFIRLAATAIASACAACSAPRDSAAIAKQYDGKVVRRAGTSPEDQKVYFVTHGSKDWITDKEWFAAHGFRWPGDVMIIPADDLALIPEGDKLH